MPIEPNRLAPLVMQIGAPGFGDALLDLLEPEFAITHFGSYQHELGKPHATVPVAAAQGAGEGERRAMMAGLKNWATNDFSSDPTVGIIEGRTTAAPGVQFNNFPKIASPSTEMQRMLALYYDPMQTGEQVDISVRRGGEIFALTLFRARGAGHFSEGERSAIHGLGAFLLSCTERHVALSTGEGTHVPVQVSTGDPGSATDKKHSWATSKAEKFARLRAALLLECDELSLRESEICAYIVMGYSAMAIGLILGISTNTVATHRKRAYAKLGLSSQTQLFDVCMRHCVT